MFLSASCNFVLCLVKLTVVAEVSPNPAVISNFVLDSILSTTLVTVWFASSVNVIWSPIFNSVLNLVPEPNTVSAASASRPIATLVPDCVASSVTIWSPAFADEPFVPFKTKLPADTIAPVVEIVPVNVLLSPYVASKEALAVYVGLPAIETPLI